MYFVIDANIVLSAMIADGITRRMIIQAPDVFLAPAYLEQEVDKYRKLVADKAELEPHEVATLKRTIFRHIDRVPQEEVLPHLHAAARLMHDIDPDDAAYVATALAYDTSPIWSDDKCSIENEGRRWDCSVTV